MVAPPLVEPCITEGRKLVDRLVRADYPIDAAYWLYLEESDSWRLYVVTALVHERGPIEALRRIQKLKRAESSLMSLDLAVISPTREIPQALMKNVRFGPKEDTKRVHHSYLDGAYIDDALVYRLAA